jgi:hypothetical protein
LTTQNRKRCSTDIIDWRDCALLATSDVGRRTLSAQVGDEALHALVM